MEQLGSVTHSRQGSGIIFEVTDICSTVEPAGWLPLVDPIAFCNIMFWAYVLENAEGVFYTGHTEDLDKRLAQHNDIDNAGTKFTTKHGPWKLVWSEMHPTRSSAMAREKQIKTMKSSRWIREHLLNGGVPMGRD